MHQITKLKIENFKSIIDSEFALSPYTPLVGYNNAGKTNILRALEWLVKKNALSASDFFNIDSPIIVSAEISGITNDLLNVLGEMHKGRIEPVVIDEKIHIRRVQAKPDIKTSELKLQVRKIDSEGNFTWSANPGGIDGSITHLFPEPIFIGAMENATEDVGKFAAGTTIGKLIKEIIEPVTQTHSGPVTEALADIAKKLSAESSEKDPNLVALDNQIQAELRGIFPGVTAKTHIPTPEFGDFLKGATIKIFEEHYHNPDGRDASSFGHGAQRAVQIALVKCLSKIKNTENSTKGRTTLLLIDEPELYLHPQAIELIRSALSKLSNEGYQVIFSTHSPNMISRKDAHNALLVKRNVANGTTSLPRIKDAVSDIIEDCEHQSETLFTLTNSSKILFCEKIILSEGKTERAILPDIFQQKIGCTMDEDNFGLVDLGGSGNISNSMKVLHAMGIPCKAIVDLDFAFKIAPNIELIPENHTAIVACKAILKRLHDAGSISIDGSGLPTKKDGVTAAKAFELMCDEADSAPHIESIHNHLLGKGVWCWTKGTIESHLGLPDKSPATHMKFLQKLNDDAFRNALPDFAKTQDMIKWLRLP